MRIGEHGDTASGDVGEHRGELSRHAQSRVAQLDRERGPRGRVVDDGQAVRIERAAEDTVTGEPVDRFPQGAGGLEGRGIGGDGAGELVAFGHPPFEVRGYGQRVVGLVPARPHGAGEIEGRTAAHIREVHVTILTGDGGDGKVVTC